jgi:hypothetical protein
VSLMVWVPSPARAASNACSSMSTRRFVMWLVYIRVQGIYLTTGGGSKLTAWIWGEPTTVSLGADPVDHNRPVRTGARDRPDERSLRRLAPRRSPCSLTPRECYGAQMGPMAL